MPRNRGIFFYKKRKKKNISKKEKAANITTFSSQILVIKFSSILRR